MCIVSIGHGEDYSGHEIKSAEENDSTLPAFVDALLLHRELSEVIRVILEAAYDHWESDCAPTINDLSFRAYAKHFPEPRRWEG